MMIQFVFNYLAVSQMGVMNHVHAYTGIIQNGEPEGPSYLCFTKSTSLQSWNLVSYIVNLKAIKLKEDVPNENIVDEVLRVHKVQGHIIKLELVSNDLSGDRNNEVMFRIRTYEGLERPAELDLRYVEGAKSGFDSRYGNIEDAIRAFLNRIQSLRRYVKTIRGMLRRRERRARNLVGKPLRRVHQVVYGLLCEVQGSLLKTNEFVQHALRFLQQRISALLERLEGSFGVGNQMRGDQIGVLQPLQRRVV